MYSFGVEDVLKGLFIYVPPGYVAWVYDLGRGVLKKVLTRASTSDPVLAESQAVQYPDSRVLDQP